MEEKIIQLGTDIARSVFMDYPDFDADQQLTLADALTILVMEQSDDLESDKVYDFLNSRLK
tara:strand:+ start:670 stop:852 length:183 start_codon:yes stop_codon:yes gene_type:complete